MSTIVRIKRSLEEDPLEALIVNCKRLKKDDESKDGNDKKSAVFAFAGTVNKEESIFKHVTKENQDTHHNLKRRLSILEKIRTESRDTSKSNRLKIVNCYRALDTSIKEPPDVGAEASAQEGVKYTVVEVESEKTGAVKESEQYVYDIYCTSATTDTDHFTLENLDYFSVEPIEDMFSSYRDRGKSNTSSIVDSDDENDENNWRNDYPDSDLDDEALLDEIYKCELSRNDEEDELSSEDDIDFYGDKKFEDIALKHGKRYAKFKLREIEDDEPDWDDDEDDDDDEYGIDRDLVDRKIFGSIGIDHDDDE